jgi:Zn-dependent protease
MANMLALLRSIRLFQFAGINVFLHWSWFIVAVYEISERKKDYSSIVWNVLEYLTLFAIVLMHEFGHSLACRKVGGQADQIVLWPLGGVAFVDPPPRPGATLWSIAAGPLVNVVLLPVFVILLSLASSSSLAQSAPDAIKYLEAARNIDIGLLVFNLLPIYPLDGGQILRALLWYAIGRVWSLMAVAILGFVGVAGLALIAVKFEERWFGIIAFFVASQCVTGFKQARSMKQMANAPRREGFACPSCRARPPVGAFWGCGSCRKKIDIFAQKPQALRVSTASILTLDLSTSYPMAGASGDANNQVACPECGERFTEMKCLDCGAVGLIEEWKATASMPLEQMSGSNLPPELARFQGALTHQPARPSALLIVFGVITSLMAVVSLLAALLFLVVSLAQIASMPEYQAKIDSLWGAEGIAIPGESTLPLESGDEYNVYLQKNSADAATADLVDIIVVSASSGRHVPVVSRMPKTFLRDGQMLVAKASFSIPASGLYTMRVSSPQTKPFNARAKIGPSADFADRALAFVLRGLTITAGVFVIIFTIVSIVLFRRYYRQRAEFKALSPYFQNMPASGQ